MVVYSQIILLMLLAELKLSMVLRGLPEVVGPFTGLKEDLMVLFKILNSIIILSKLIIKLTAELFYGIKVLMV